MTIFLRASVLVLLLSGCASNGDDEDRNLLRVSTGASDIYSVAADGSSLRRITRTDRAYEGDFSLSPDRTKLAFFRFRRDGAGRLVVANADGSGELDLGPVRPNEDFRQPPVWSPDGTRIAWADACGDIFCADQEIWTVSVTTRHRRRLATFAVQPAWSPDGLRLAYTRAALVEDPSGAGEKHETSVVVSRADGSAARQIAADASTPAWSPDASRLAFLRRGNLIVARADGSGQTAVARHAGEFAWAPGGRLIAVWIPSVEAPAEVRIVDVDARAARCVATGSFLQIAGEVVSPFSPDGRKLAWAERSRLVIVSSRGSFRRVLQIAPRNAAPSWPAWSRDGRSVYFSAP